MVVILTCTLKGCCDLFPDSLMISNNTAKPAFKRLDASYAFCIIVLTASWRKFSCGEYSFCCCIDISSISGYLVFGSLLVSCWIILNDNLLKCLLYLVC